MHVFLPFPQLTNTAAYVLTSGAAYSKSALARPTLEIQDLLVRARWSTLMQHQNPSDPLPSSNASAVFLF